MKKLFIVLGMLLCAGALFCSENSALFNSDAGAYSRVSYYLDNNFSSVSLKFKNINQVAADLDNLSFDQKADLYEEYSKSGALYFGLLKSLKITYINFPGQYLTCYRGSNMRVEILYVIPVMHIVSMVRGQGVVWEQGRHC